MEKYYQISIFDLIENQNKQTEKEYDRCDYCNMPCCYNCKYIEEGGETNDNTNTGRV